MAAGSLRRVSALPLIFCCVCLVIGCGQNPAPKIAPPIEKAAATAAPVGPAFAEVPRVDTVAVSPDGKFVAALFTEPGSGGMASIGIWELATGKLQINPINGHFEQVAFSADGKKLIGIGSVAKKICTWDAATGTETASAPLPGWKENEGGTGSATLAPFLAVSADGKHTAAIYNANKLIKWPIGEPKVDLHSSDITHFRGAAYSPALDVFVVGLQNRALLITKMGENKGAAKKIDLEYVPRALAFSGDGKTLAVCLNGKDAFDDEANKTRFDRVEIWDAENWKLRSTFPKKKDDPDFLAFGNSLRPWGQIAVSSDGKMVAGIPGLDNERPVELWDTVTQTRRIVDKGARPSFVAFTPNDKALVVGYYSNGIKLIDISK